MKLLCKLGLHWRIKLIDCAFIDQVDHQEVFKGRCSCGKIWLYNGIEGFPFFKVEVADDR